MGIFNYLSSGIGFICCVLRILFCICPSHCIKNRRKRNGKVNKVDADHRTSLLHSNSKRVQIARGPNSNPSVSIRINWQIIYMILMIIN